MRECGKYVKMRDFPRGCGMVDTSATYIDFGDFKAAFESVSRHSLWKILQICGVPQERSVLVRQ